MFHFTNAVFSVTEKTVERAFGGGKPSGNVVFPTTTDSYISNGGKKVRDRSSVLAAQISGDCFSRLIFSSPLFGGSFTQIAIIREIYLNDVNCRDGVRNDFRDCIRDFNSRTNVRIARQTIHRFCCSMVSVSVITTIISSRKICRVTETVFSRRHSLWFCCVKRGVIFGNLFSG